LDLKDKKLKKICGYVQQDDVILDTMTVREAITMAALLRLPRAMSLDAKLARVNQVIELMHLQKCAESVIGSHLIKGISGGERKRVSIAMVMITNPSILYLDEPTSGLDAFTAYSICNTLKNVARTGRTVAATIHQPSSDIFHLFDDLVLLSEGKIIYHGPAEHMVPYFAKQGYVCPQYTNPADYLFMSILNDAKKMADEGDRKGPTSQEQAAKLAELAENWLKSGEAAQYVVEPLKLPTQGGFKTSDVLERAPFTSQFYLLSQRALRNAWRNKLMLKGRFAQTIFLGVLMGLIFLQLGTDQRGIQDREGSLFFVAVNGIMTSTMGVLSIFAAEKNVFIREYESGLYRLPAYFLSRTFVELPFKVVFPIIGGTILYWLVGYQDVASKYVLMVFIMVILENCGTALGIFVASFFEDIAVALAVVPMFLMPLMIFSGFFVNAATSPAFLQWIKYISPMKYAFVALVKNEFSDLQLHCTESQMTPIPITKPDGSTTLMPYCARTNGEQVISLLGFDSEGSIAVNVIVLAAMYFILLILAYLALWRQLRMRK
jgi:ATP-binding cassette subfamily G (WHITE) protein 1